jgi:endonuclease/exonuclease/phosphatase family metal-dependent hydrolase
MRWAAAVLVVVLGLALPASAGPQRTVVVLQMNLCNSGISGCYTDRSVAKAAELIRAYAPDVVALNEICHEDVTTLAAVFPKGTVTAAFQTAPDRRTGAGTLCVNRQEFGIGLIVRTSGPATAQGGVYQAQDLSDPEIRAWLCITGQERVCTAHLASTSVAVAQAQCGQLLQQVVPGHGPAVVAGDFNLRDPDVRMCVPGNYERTGDSDVQYVMATHAAVISRQVVDMGGTTDHPALVAVLGTPAISANPPSMG